MSDDESMVNIAKYPHFPDGYPGYRVVSLQQIAAIDLNIRHQLTDQKYFHLGTGQHTYSPPMTFVMRGNDQGSTPGCDRSSPFASLSTSSILMRVYSTVSLKNVSPNGMRPRFSYHWLLLSRASHQRTAAPMLEQ